MWAVLTGLFWIVLHRAGHSAWVILHSHCQSLPDDQFDNSSIVLGADHHGSWDQEELRAVAVAMIVIAMNMRTHVGGGVCCNVWLIPYHTRGAHFCWTNNMYLVRCSQLSTFSGLSGGLCKAICMIYRCHASVADIKSEDSVTMIYHPTIGRTVVLEASRGRERFSLEFA